MVSHDRRRRERLARLLEEIEETEDLADTESTGTFSDLVIEDGTTDRLGSIDLVSQDVPTAVGELPIPKPWQGLQRAAVVFNLNFVWDPEEEEWIRDEGNGGGGGGPTEVASGTQEILNFGGQVSVDTGVEGSDRTLLPLCSFIDETDLPSGNTMFLSWDYGTTASDNLNYEFGYSRSTGSWILTFEQTSNDPINVRWRIFEFAQT